MEKDEQRATGGNEGTRNEFARYLREMGSGFGGSGAAMVRVGSEDVPLHPPKEGVRYDVAVVDSTDGIEGSGGSGEPAEGLVIEARWRATGEWASAAAHNGRGRAGDRDGPD